MQRQALGVFEHSQFAGQRDRDVGIGADAEPPALPHERLAAEDAVAQIGLGDGAKAGHGPRAGDAGKFAVIEMRRMTVNRALRELSRDGIITRVQGVGSFVATTAPNTSLSEVRDIRDIIAERGGAHRCRVLDARRTRLDAALAPLFEAAPGLEVFHLTVLHCENGRPLQIERRHADDREHRGDLSPHAAGAARPFA